MFIPKEVNQENETGLHPVPVWFPQTSEQFDDNVAALLSLSERI